jgi:hypothetical protein
MSLAGQDLTNNEIKSIADAIYQKINNDTTIRSIALKTLMFTGDTSTTELGVYVATQLLLYLDKPGKRFSIVDRSKMKELFKEVKVAETGLIDRDGPKLGRARSIHVLLEGTLHNKGNYLEVTLNATQLETTTTAHSVQGFITITPSIQKMLKKGNTTKPLSKTEPKPIDKKTKNTTYYSVFKKNELKFDLLHCEKKGRYIECEFRIENEGRNDAELYVYSQGSRIINKDGGIEYNISTLKLAEKTNSEQINKTITGTGYIIGLFTFENVIESPTTLSKLELKCWSGSEGWFSVDINDIPVTNNQ